MECLDKTRVDLRVLLKALRPKIRSRRLALRQRTKAAINDNVVRSLPIIAAIGSLVSYQI